MNTAIEILGKIAALSMLIFLVSGLLLFMVGIIFGIYKAFVPKGRSKK